MASPTASGRGCRAPATRSPRPAPTSDAHEQEAAAEALEEADLKPGDLVFFGPRERADHIAFWLGEGRILHAAGRDGVHAVLEEPLADARGEHDIRYGRL